MYLYITENNMEYDFHRNANVVVTQGKDSKHNIVANILVDDQYEHRFGHNSRIAKQLQLMTPDDLSEQLSGGQFFFVDGNLYDFRDSQYKGYVHNDDTISHLNDLLGIHDKSATGLRVQENVTARSVTLGRKWSNQDILIEAFREGGEFESELHYGWSPFMKTINSAFKLNRLVCTNGMRGLRNFMNLKIPLVNRWEEHLEIANVQIQNKVNAIVQRRMVQMASERASVAELLTLSSHAVERIRDDKPECVGANRQLRGINDIVDPRRHLSNVYQSHIFKKTSVSAQYPGHLTTLDAYNIATEIRSHSLETGNSTTRAMDLIANDLVFDHTNIILPASGKVSRKVSSFSDADAAFFGNVH